MSESSSVAAPTAAEIVSEQSSMPRGWIVAWSRSQHRRYYCRIPKGKITELKQFHPPTELDAVPAEEESSEIPSRKRPLEESAPAAIDESAKSAKLQVGSSDFSTPVQVQKLLEFSRLVIAVNVYNSLDVHASAGHWETDYSNDPPQELIDLPAPPARVYVEDSPGLIYSRKLAFDRLDHYLTKLCLEAKLESAPVNAFQRWGFAQRSIQLGGCDAAVDPLIPMRPGIDRALEWELIRVGLTEERSREICSRLATAAASEAKKLLEARAKDAIDDSLEAIELTPPDGDRMFVHYRAVNYSIPINFIHYQKLKRLYEVHTEKVNENSLKTFARRLFAVLARYDTIAGAGYQAAVPEKCFDFLRSSLGVTHESFASPLNQYLSSFGSAFPDVDRFFGSQGSFFDLRPSEGSFESNPPFLEEVMTPNAQHILALIHRAELRGKSLCFVVIWPGWSDCPAYEFLIASPFCRWFLELGKNQHSYKEGYQHRSSVPYRKSGAKSFLFVIQTSAANKIQPVTEEIKRNIIEKFK